MINNTVVKFYEYAQERAKYKSQQQIVQDHLQILAIHV